MSIGDIRSMLHFAQSPGSVPFEGASRPSLPTALTGVFRSILTSRSLSRLSRTSGQAWLRLGQRSPECEAEIQGFVPGRLGKLQHSSSADVGTANDSSSSGSFESTKKTNRYSSSVAYSGGLTK